MIKPHLFNIHPRIQTTMPLSSLSTTQTAAFERGMAFLGACGLRFAVELPDQSFVGSLPVPKEAAAAILSPRQPRRNLDPKFGHKAKVDAMVQGELLKFVAESDEEATALASIVASRGFDKFGAGSCISSKRGLNVELLRVL